MGLSHGKLETPLQYMKGIGEKLSKQLSRLGLYTVFDFIYFLPRSYEDRRDLPLIKDLKSEGTQSCLGTIQGLKKEQVSSKTRLLKASLRDATGSIELIWFNQGFLAKVLKPNTKVLVKGSLSFNSFSQSLQMTVSETELLRSSVEEKKGLNCILPVYPLVSGLYQSKMREISRSVQSYIPYLTEYFSEPFRQKYSLNDLLLSLRALHFPVDEQSFRAAKRRLIFDELFFLTLPYVLRRHSVKQGQEAIPLKEKSDMIPLYIDSLPYSLTGAQSRVFSEIKADLTKSSSMNRLLQGDVGAGKTELAVLTLLMAVDNSLAAALLAPTEILAEQHYLKLQKNLAQFSIPIYLLKGKLPAKQKRELLAKLALPGPKIIVGTHAIIQDKVVIADLAVMVIDEQHRFGVFQRMKLQQKGRSPHALYMTATPIPRTLSLSLYGDLDKSIIDELPSGRRPPKTYVVPNKKLADAHSFCLLELQKGRQVFIVYPLVEESEKLDLEAAVTAYETLQSTVFSKYSLGLIHGKLSAEEKASVMSDFKSKKTMLLVATTVIEVGIDVPNATVMVIMHAERYGLSQLHQLRGRIGRGDGHSSCFLMASPKSPASKQRLKAMMETTDGFRLAEIDLKIRGAGDMLGTKQAGLDSLSIASLTDNDDELLLARKAADALLEEDPTLDCKENQGIREKLMSQYSWCLDGQLN